MCSCVCTCCNAQLFLWFLRLATKQIRSVLCDTTTKRTYMQILNLFSSAVRIVDRANEREGDRKSERNEQEMIRSKSANRIERRNMMHKRVNANWLSVRAITKSMWIHCLMQSIVGSSCRLSFIIASQSTVSGAVERVQKRKRWRRTTKKLLRPIKGVTHHY